MIITKAPFRISFFGGGSDIEDYYLNHSGAVLSATINKYVYISSHHFFSKDQIRLKYSQTETVFQTKDIKHNIFRQVLEEFNVNGAIELSSNADIPSGTGMGSSSAFTVALLLNKYTRNNHQVDKYQLASKACEIEINKLKAPIGKQDQFASTFGGLNRICFPKSGKITVTPIQIQPEIKKKLKENLILICVGNRRDANDYLRIQKQNYKKEHIIAIQKEMVDLVTQSEQALLNQDLTTFAKNIDYTWQLKQKLSEKITNKSINELYDHAKKNGAIGGKLLGAGGAGFMLFYCEKENQKKLKHALKNTSELVFDFEDKGADVVHVSDE